MIRAEEVQSNLEPAFPSFVKSLVRSHVASCFWMVRVMELHELELVYDYNLTKHSSYMLLLGYFCITGASWNIL
jgi:hypothetical protein